MWNFFKMTPVLDTLSRGPHTIFTGPHEIYLWSICDHRYQYCVNYLRLWKITRNAQISLGMFHMVVVYCVEDNKKIQIQLSRAAVLEFMNSWHTGMLNINCAQLSDSERTEKWIFWKIYYYSFHTYIYIYILTLKIH